jgi:hypothetical protein
MTDTKPLVEFEPVETKTRGEWQIRATLPSGKQVCFGGFNSAAEAREWIARKSDAWLQLKACEASRNV